jgi:hypothetical protein
VPVGMLCWTAHTDDCAEHSLCCCCRHLCRETLRLSNVVSSLAVEAAQDLQLGEYAVPAGTAMSIPFIQLAKNDPRWLNDEPEKFRCAQTLLAVDLSSGYWHAMLAGDMHMLNRVGGCTSHRMQCKCCF